MAAKRMVSLQILKLFFAPKFPENLRVLLKFEFVLRNTAGNCTLEFRYVYVYEKN